MHWRNPPKIIFPFHLRSHKTYDIPHFSLHPWTRAVRLARIEVDEQTPSLNSEFVPPHPARGTQCNSDSRYRFDEPRSADQHQVSPNTVMKGVLVKLNSVVADVVVKLAYFGKIATTGFSFSTTFAGLRSLRDRSAVRGFLLRHFFLPRAPRARGDEPARAEYDILTDHHFHFLARGTGSSTRSHALTLALTSPW